MKLKTLLLASGLLAFASPAFANGVFEGAPLIGGAPYCVSFLNGSCIQNSMQGPLTITGNEVAPLNEGPLGVVGLGVNDWGLLTVGQLGQGSTVDQTTVGTTQTIPNGVAFFYLDGAQGSALTVTMPSAPLDGTIVNVVCEAATVGVLTVAANTSQSLKVNPNAACVAGVGYAWRYTLANTTWYRIK